jgi:hypothetical protein
MDVDELIARESIRDLVARYNSTGDTGRFDETIALFAPDAVLELPNSIRALFEGVRSSVGAAAGDRPRFLRHCTATLQIDLTSPTTAKARCYFFVLTADGLDHWGRYIDEMAVVDGEWRFTRRRAITDGRVEGGLGSAHLRS